MNFKLRVCIVILMTQIILAGKWLNNPLCAEEKNIIIEYELIGMDKVHIEKNNIGYTYKVLENEDADAAVSLSAEYVTVSAQLLEEEWFSLLKLFEENKFLKLKKKYGKIKNTEQKYNAYYLRFKNDEKDKTVVYNDVGINGENPPVQFDNLRQAVLDLVDNKFENKIKKIQRADIVFATSAARYIAEELLEIKITLTNNLDEPIYLASHSLENLQANIKQNWVSLQGWPQGVKPYIYKIIPAKTTFEKTIVHPHFCTNQVESKVGQYRFAEKIYLESEGVGIYHPVTNCAYEILIYSNEFIVE